MTNTAEMQQIPQESMETTHPEFDPNEGLTHFQKVNLANQLRLMADSQRVLNQTNKRTKLFTQWESANVLGLNPEDSDMAGDDDMKISIDSPEIHHNYPTPAPVVALPPTPAPQGISPLMKIAAAGLLAATGVGIPATVGLAMLPSIIKAWKGETPPPVTPPQTNNLLSEYDLFVGPPPGKDN